MALPTKPSMIGGEDDDASKEYYEALQKTLDALDARANQGPNWFQLAGAFLDPGRTGSFGEALGNAGKVLGAQQEQQQAQMLPIAQMRAEIAGQKYEAQNTAKAIGMLSTALQTPAQQIVSTLESGQKLPPEVAKQITPDLYIAIAKLSPKVGEMVAKVIGMQTEQTRTGIQQSQLDLDKQKFEAEQNQRKLTNAQADLKNGMDLASLKAKYGDVIISMIPGYAPPGGASTAPAPASMPTSGSVAAPNAVGMGGAGLSVPSGSSALMPPPVVRPAPNLSPAAAATPSIPQMRAEMAMNPNAASTMPVPGAAPATAAVPRPVAPPPLTVTPPTPQNMSNTSGLPLEARIAADKAAAEEEARSRIAIEQKRVEAKDSEWKDKRASILTYDPSVTTAQTRDLKELYDIANKKPYIFGVLQKEGAIAAMKAAAQEGVSTPWGSFSLPTKVMEEKYNLSPDDQRDLSIAQKILGRQFFENAKSNKSVLGPSISNSDVMLLKSPLITDQDSAEAIKYWVKQNVLLNKQKDELYKSLTSFDEKYGAKAPPSRFFTGPEYQSIFNRYDELFRELTRNHSPVFSSQQR